MPSPNIVLVMADQHRADILGCAGDPHVVTPNLDRLAAEGVRFARTTCQGPLCMPARASFLTERYVRDHGVFTNWNAVEPGTPTYLHALREAGYHTVALGKHHLTSEDEPAPHMDSLADRLEERGFAEVHETGDKFTLSVPTRYSDHLAAKGLWDTYLRHMRDRSYQGQSGRGDNPTKRIPMWDATPIGLPLADYIDPWHGDLAVDWIEGYSGEAPFFAFVGFPGPHDPWDAPTEAIERYASGDTSFPVSTRRPDVERAGSYGRLLRAFLRLSDTDTMTDDAIRDMRRAYAASVSVIDAQVGRILDALAARGMLDDTWVIYTSDHGEMGGNHGMMSKCVLYDPAVQVPLIVRPPASALPKRAAGRVVDDLVEHLDVPATVRAIAGAPAVPSSDGRSLLGYVAGDDPEPRPVSISENWGFASFDTGAFKLVVDEDSGAPCALFDRSVDPAEDENVVLDPQYAGIVDELLETRVRPFLGTPPARPYASPFTDQP
jgi:choline-sulfatase